MEILARAVGRRKEAVAQIQLVRGNGQFLINDKPAQAYLQNNSCSLICIKSPLETALSLYSNKNLNTQMADKVINEKQEEQNITIEQTYFPPSFIKGDQTEKSGVLNNKEVGFALARAGASINNSVPSFLSAKENEKNTLKNTLSLSTTAQNLPLSSSILKEGGDASLGGESFSLNTENLKENLVAEIITSPKKTGAINTFSKKQSFLEDVPNAEVKTVLNISGDESKNFNLRSQSNAQESCFALSENVVSLDEIDVIIKVKGGGLIGQAEAIKLGIARAFCIMQATLAISSTVAKAEIKKILKTKGYLTQDSRVKERRKYGLKKARKASQYHKR